MAKKSNDPEKKARVHKDLEGFEMKISPTGEVLSNYSHDQLNEFLNKHVKDKKLTAEQKSEQDDRMFPIQNSSTDEVEDDEAFLREAGLMKRGSKKKKGDEEVDDTVPPRPNADE